MSEHLVITVHGIQTFGQWQERLQRLLQKADPTVQVENYHYGYFSVIAFLLPFFRWWATRQFRKHFLRIVHDYPNRRVSIVSHSFGTHLVAWGIRGIPRSERPRVENVVLAGSVLRSSFPWGELLDQGSVGRVINDCGIDDNVLILSQVCVLMTGMAGRLGFTGMTSERLMNRYFRGDHSHYFLENGKPSDNFMARHWVPLLAHDTVVQLVDERAVKGPLQGITITLLQIADPLKFATYLAIIGGLAYFGYFGPREREAAARARARFEEVRRLANAATASGQIGASAVNQLALAHTLDTGNALPQLRETLSYWLMYLKDVRELTEWLPDPSTFNWGDETYARIGTRVMVLPGERKLRAWIRGNTSAVYTLDPDGKLRLYRLPEGVETASVTLPRGLLLSPSLYELAEGKVVLIKVATAAVTVGVGLWEVSSGRLEALPIDLLRSYQYGSHNPETYSDDKCAFFGVPEEQTEGERTVSHSLRTVQVTPEGTLRVETRKLSDRDDWDTVLRRAKLTMRLDESKACDRNEVAVPQAKLQEAVSRGGLNFMDGSDQPWIRFPALVSESALWKKGGAQDQRGSDRDAALYSDRRARLRPATLTDQKRFAGLIRDYLSRAEAKDQSGNPTQSNYLYLLRWALDDLDTGDFASDSIVDLDGESIYYSTGSLGAQGGKHFFCRAPKPGADVVCAFVRFAGDYGHLAEFSKDLSYFVSSNRSGIESGSFNLVDLRGMRVVAVEPQPFGTIVAAAFSESGDQLAVMSGGGDAFLYALRPQLSLISRSTVGTNANPVADEGAEFSRLCAQFHGGVLIYCNASGDLTAVDTDTWNTLWSVRALVQPDEPLELFWSKGSNVAAIFTQHKVKLVRLSDGVGLSEWLVVSALRASGKSVVADVGFRSDGLPIIKLGAEWFVRESPLSDQAVAQALRKLECFTGLEKGGSQRRVDRLPCL